MKIGLGIGIPNNRASSGSDFSPGDIPGIQLWLESDLGITLVGSDVNVWADQSGNGNDASAPASINRPAYITDAINGLPVLDFQASEYFRTPVVTGSQEWSVFAVFAPDTTNVTHYIDADDSFSPTSRYAQFLRSTTALQCIAFNSSEGAFTDATGTVNASTYYIGSAVRGASSVETWLNGASNGSTATTGTPAALNRYWTIGKRDSDGAGTMTGDSCKIAAILAYNTALSSSDRASVESYLATKFNITLA